MLKVQSNVRRSATSLNGIWNFKTTDADYLPTKKAENCVLMPVPASMNDVGTSAKIRDHVGKVLYETEFSVPICGGNEYRLRIGATSHKCEVFLNGAKIGGTDNAFMPIDIPLNDLKNKNRLSVIIDNRLDYHTLPVGRLVEGNGLYVCDRTGKHAIYGDPQNFQKEKQVINHDFYNYTGIHRDVFVYSVPKKHIEDVVIETVVGGDYEKVKVTLKGDATNARFKVTDEEGKVVCESENGELRISAPRLWNVKDPYLYTLAAETETDYYEEQFGIRKVSFDETGLYVNDKKVYLKGFGMHEDFTILGKGNNSAVNVRDFELLKWINANCFRTSHYPYAEEIMDLADKYGFLVINEVPAVGCNNWPDYTYGKDRLDDVTLALHKNAMRLLVERDKNHPSVVMYSVANEAATYEDNARTYFKEVIDYTRSLTSLPVTIVELTHFVEGNKVVDLVDFIGINRYYGWYDEIGNLDAVEPLLRAELEAYADHFKKPIIMTEFGADTIEGLHSLPSVSFSEDYQKELLAETCRVLDELPFICGELVWNFADFMTKEGTIRVNGNRKGVFTRARQPKAAAYVLKERWKKKNSKED